jgi:hypothetical protein
MSLDDEKTILDAMFKVVDHIDMLHLSGGGEPFLHPHLSEMIEVCMDYKKLFDKLMVFTNSTVPISGKLLNTLKKYKENVIVHASNYHVYPEKENALFETLKLHGINHRVINYHGDDQDFGGWVDFGEYAPHGRSAEELKKLFVNCAITRDMHGNWRTRNGCLHWCSRSEIGTTLKLISSNEQDYVDLFDKNTSVEEKREKIKNIMNAEYITACDYCSGDHGTSDASKRYPAAEQIL